VNETAAYVEHHEAEQPQNEEYYRNRPQHCPGSAKKGLRGPLALGIKQLAYQPRPT
jgi:hypothetical protein